MSKKLSDFDSQITIILTMIIFMIFAINMLKIIPIIICCKMTNVLFFFTQIKNNNKKLLCQKIY